ncbi:MAG: Smr/MutS family protein [bacterium]
MVCKVVDLEAGRPTAEVALQRLNSAIFEARRARIKYLKIIHGYGSSGVGGKIKAEVTVALRGKKVRNEIKAFIPGGDWSLSNADTQDILAKYPVLRRDSDLNRQNSGISIVVL